MPNHIINLALDILEDHFGYAAKEVGHAIYTRGKASLRDIVQVVCNPVTGGPPITAQEVKSALIVMTVHNVLSVSSIRLKKEGEEASLPSVSSAHNSRKVGVVLYELLPWDIIGRLRFPRFLLHAKTKFGEEAKLILQQLMTEGFATKEAILSSVGDQPEVEGPDAVERAFQQLVRERYIQRRRELSLPVDLLSGEPTQAGGFLVGDEGMSISMAAALEAKANASVEAMTSAASKKGRKAKAKPSSARGKKRGNTEENGGSGGGMEAKEEPSVGELWVLLPDQFLRDFRHESVLKYVKEKLSPLGASLLRGFLAVSMARERTAGERHSIPISLLEAYENVPEAEKKKLTWDLAGKWVQLLCRSTVGFLLKESEGADGGRFVICFDAIIDSLRRRTFDSIITDKYDAEAARIIRLLREKRYLDAEQISDIALLPAKKARSILYRLFQDGIIRKQEIPRRSDYDPEYTFFLWGLEENIAFSQVVQDMCHAILNMRLRNGMVIPKVKALERRSDRSPEEEAKLKKLQGAQDRLDTAVLHLERTLTLMTVWLDEIRDEEPDEDADVSFAF